MLKKKCPKCQNKIDRKYQFCPFCGDNLNTRDIEDYGFLGRDDFDDSFKSMFNNLPIDKIFRNAMKIIEKQMRNLEQPKQSHENTKMNVQFFVNGKRVFPDTKFQKSIPIKPIKTTGKIPKQKADKFIKFPKKEPVSKVRRFSGKLIYELSMPGVKDINDVLINQLESSIEIKALGKNKVYSKILNINLPIISFKLEKGNLILELQAK